MTKQKIGVYISSAILVVGAAMLALHNVGSLEGAATTVLHQLNSIPADAWSVIVETVFGAIIVTSQSALIKKWVNRNGKKLYDGGMIAVVIFGSFAAGVVGYLHGTPLFAPWFAVVQGALVFVTTQPVFFLGIRPLFEKLGEVIMAEVAKATAVSEAQSAAVPAQGLPQTTINDILA